MECSDKNQLYIKKYESLVSEKYKEPVEGRFEDATADILTIINPRRACAARVTVVVLCSCV